MPEPRPVLITRPEPGASETAARVAAIGLHPIVAPVLAIAVVTARLPAPDRIAAILLTSRNAVPAFGPAWHGHAVFTVGQATARQAQAAGFRVIRSADGDAGDLARLVVATQSPAAGILLLASGRGQGRPLAAALREAGFKVLHRIVYAAAPVAALSPAAVDALKQGSLTSMFFSTETARHFVWLLQEAGLADTVRDSEAVAISRRVGVALGALPWRRIRVAVRPNQDEMLALLP